MMNSVYFSLYVQLISDTWLEVKYHIQRCRTFSACTHIFNKYTPLLVYFIYVLHIIIYNTWLHVCPRAFDCCSYIIYEHRTLADFHISTVWKPSSVFVLLLLWPVYNAPYSPPPAHRCPPPRAVTTTAAKCLRPTYII